MSAPRTSVIMPVYKTAATVVSSIQSVVNQTDGDLELIVVVDGSPDDSAHVIEEYLEEHPDDRVRVFNNPVNSGVSACRNQALAEARGEWIAFLDSDDHFDRQFLVTMHEILSAAHADIAVCAHVLASSDGSEQTRARVPQGIYDGFQAALMLLEDKLTPYVWDKVFRANLFDDVRFATDVHRAEDAIVVLETTRRATSVVATDKALHQYTVDPHGLTWGRVTPLAESDRLMELMAQATGPLLHTSRGRRALDVSYVLTYLNNAQQALIADNEETESVLSACRQRITWGQVRRAFIGRPVFGAAAALLKLSTRTYRALYGRYVMRTYGIHGSSRSRV